MINEELRQAGATDKDLRQRTHRKLNKYSYQNIRLVWFLLLNKNSKLKNKLNI